MNPNEILSILDKISTHTIETLKTFSTSDWDAPSRCHMWANKDIAAHLVGILGFNLNSINMALAQNSLPGEGMPNPGTFHSVDIAPAIASRAIQLSETSLKNKHTLIETLSTMKNDLIIQGSSISSTEWDLDAYHPINIVSIKEILLIILLEITVHTWDIFNALEDDYEVDQEAAVLLINLWKNSQANRWFITSSTPENSDLNPKVIDVNLGTVTTLRITDFDGDLEIFEKPSSAKAAPTTINTTPKDFALLITARVNLFDLIDREKVTTEGDKNNLLLFHNWFKGT